MTIDDLLERNSEAIAAKLAERKTHSDIITEVRSACDADSRRDPNAEETARVEAASEARAQIDEQIRLLEAKRATLEAEKRADEAADTLSRERHTSSTLPNYDRVARVGQEERTYTEQKNRRGQASFFSDAYNARENSDFAARERLERHSTEVRVEGELKGYAARAASTASFAGLVVPQYLVDQVALIARAGRPYANTCVGLALPEDGMSFHIPRGTTGASAAAQATENSSVSSTDEVFSDVVLPVATVAGQQDVSRQSLERGTAGLDTLVYMDLAGAYGVAVDGQCLSGSGSSGQVLGTLATSGINQATAFGAAATVTTFYSKLAGQINAVETTRFMAPTAIAMHPRRWNWLVSQVDSSGRPITVPEYNGPFNAIAVFDTPVDTPAATPVGQIQGLPVITDASIPTSVGTGPEDQVIVYRREDQLLYEVGDGMPQQLRFEQTLGNQLTVKLVAYSYIAFTSGRYPTAVGVVGGNAGTAGFGLIAPVF